MKKFSRCLAIVPLVAAAIGFQSVSATAAETMADQYQPRIDGDGVVRDSQPYIIDFEVLDYPEGTHFTIQASDGHSDYVKEEGCYAKVYDESYGLSVLTSAVDGRDKNYEGWTIPGNRYIYPSVLVDYPMVPLSTSTSRCSAAFLTPILSSPSTKLSHSSLVKALRSTLAVDFLDMTSLKVQPGVCC